jgi:cephalosporin-C deacetylase-like acetyl esterase
MNLNLALPYGQKCSPPQTPELVFYSHQSENLIFGGEQKIEITCQAGVRSVGLTWSLHRNMIAKPFLEGKAEALPSNCFKIVLSTTQLQPGFYDLKVKLDNGTSKPIDGICVFGWKPQSLAIRDTRPADFQKFWETAIAEYARIPLDVRVEDEVQTFRGKEIDAYNVQHAALPPDYDPSGHKYEEVESCKISFAGPDGGRVYGWLAKPKGDGPFPAMLVLPGAGFGARPRPLEHARHGYIALDIQIHGQDVDQKEYEKLPGYSENVIFEPIEGYYYRNVYLRACRAVDMLCSRADVRQDRIAAVGGSQGGRLSIIVAALDKRVKAIVSCIVNSPNFPHLHWVAKCNGLSGVSDNLSDPKFKDAPKFDGMDLVGAPPQVDDPEGRCFAYYDPMNFAPDVHCPVLMNAGLIDPVSPPFSPWAVFNRLGTSDKQIIPLPGLGHDWSAEFDRMAWKWLDKRFN